MANGCWLLLALLVPSLVAAAGNEATPVLTPEPLPSERAVAVNNEATPVLTLEPSPSERAAVLERSRALANAFMAELKAALGQALAEQGVAGAVGVCRERAPAIAARLSRESGAKVSRKAQRFRNPAAGLDALEVGHWAEFARQPLEAPGRPRELLLAHESTDGRHLRYLRAIPTAAMCLGCHGSQIDPAVQAALDEHYPDDRATGFAEGDLRGLFSIDWPPGVPGPAATD